MKKATKRFYVVPFVLDVTTKQATQPGGPFFVKKAYSMLHRRGGTHIMYCAKDHLEAAQKAKNWFLSWGGTYFGLSADFATKPVFLRVKERHTPRGEGIKDFWMGSI